VGSYVTAFIQASPFIFSPLANLPLDLLANTPSDLHTVLLAYLRLVSADTAIATRLNWPTAPLHALRTQHSDKGVRLLAIQVLAKQRQWGEEKRMLMEKEWVGEVDKVDADIRYGQRVVLQPAGGFTVEDLVVDGWMLPIFEVKRVQACECYHPTRVALF
jgi:midasin